MKKIAAILAVLFLGTFLVAGSAMADIIIDFESGNAGGTGLVTVDSAGNITGTGIGLDRMLIAGTDTEYDGNWNVDGPVDYRLDGVLYSNAAGSLDFDTFLNEITVTGSIPSLYITEQELAWGSFDGWSWNPTTYKFEGWGNDQKAEALLDLLGIPTETEFSFYTFILTGAPTRRGVAVNDIQISFYDDYQPVSVDIRNSVPEPASMLLLGAGLFGLAIVGRKRFTK